VSGSICFSVIIGEMRLRINLPKILAKRGRRLIGLKEVKRSGGLLGLGNIKIVENFQTRGT